MILTDKNRANLNALARLMRAQTVTKEQVMGVFGVSERVARDMISEVGKRVPVISLSDRRGYRIALSAGDLGDVRHALNEILSRQEELEKRAVPLKKFIEAQGEARA